MRILVTDGLNKNTLAILRTLGKSKYWVGITTDFPRIATLGFYSKYCKKVHILKSDTGDIDAYSQELLNILSNTKYDVLLPVGLRSCLAVSKRKKQFQELTNVVVPDWEKMRIAYSRDKATNFANQIGVPTPKTYILDTENELSEIDTYPVVMKSTDDYGSSIKYCNNKQEAERNLANLKSRGETNIIAQEYIRGFGCGFYGLYANGQLVAHFMHRRIREFPITGGASAAAESYFDEKLFNWGRELCDALEWHGPIMVEFKYDVVDEQYKLIEVNPKLWGSLDLTIEAGVNVPVILVRLAFGEKVNESEHYKYVKYRWVFPDECKVLMSRFSLGNVVEFFKFGNHTKTNLNLSDPVPTLIQVARGLLEGLAIIFSKSKRFPHGRVS